MNTKHVVSLGLLYFLAGLQPQLVAEVVGGSIEEYERKIIEDRVAHQNSNKNRFKAYKAQCKDWAEPFRILASLPEKDRAIIFDALMKRLNLAQRAKAFQSMATMGNLGVSLKFDIARDAFLKELKNLKDSPTEEEIAALKTKLVHFLYLADEAGDWPSEKLEKKITEVEFLKPLYSAYKELKSIDGVRSK